MRRDALETYAKNDGLWLFDVEIPIGTDANKSYWELAVLCACEERDPWMTKVMEVWSQNRYSQRWFPVHGLPEDVYSDIHDAVVSQRLDDQAGEDDAIDDAFDGFIRKCVE